MEFHIITIKGNRIGKMDIDVDDEELICDDLEKLLYTGEDFFICEKDGDNYKIFHNNQHFFNLRPSPIQN